MEETSIHLEGDFSAPFADALMGGLSAALTLQSKLPASVIQLTGMSGRRYRHMINEVIARVAGPRYLEVGSWVGSTAASAMFGNRLTLTCIDNWESFPGFLDIHDPRQAFEATIAPIRSPEIDMTIIQNDFRQVDYGSVGAFNIYLFDGPHEYQDQYDGVKIAQPALDNLYIQIVDDWNWAAVRNGTFDALRDSNASVLFSIEVRTTQDDTHPQINVMQNSDWHNGYFFAVVKRLPAA